MADVSVTGPTQPANPDERDAPDVTPRKRERPKPRPASGATPSAPEPPPHDGQLDVVV